MAVRLKTAEKFYFGAKMFLDESGNIPIIELIVGLIILVFLYYPLMTIANSFFNGLQNVSTSEETELALAASGNAKDAISEGLNWLGVFLAIGVIAIVLMTVINMFR